MIVLRALCVAALSLWLSVTVAFAQVGPEPAVELTSEAYAEWEVLALRAEEVVDRALASTAALEIMRSQLAEWRDRFRAGQSTQSARIATLRDQITALGDPPAEGEAEPFEITQRRSVLRAQLAELEAPGRAATEAFQRASGLIGEVDQIIADRQAEALFDVAPAPVNPVHWWPALQSAGTYGAALNSEIVASFDTETEREAVVAKIVPLGLLLLVAFLLLARASRWWGGLVDRIARTQASSARARLGVLLTSAGYVVLPILGVLALSEAGLLAGLSGIRTQALVSFAPWFVFVIMGARWLGQRTFPVGAAPFPILTLTPEHRGEGRWHAGLLGIFYALWLVLELLAQTGETIGDYISVLGFPLILLAGLVLLRLAQLLLIHARTVIENSEEAVFLPRVVRVLAQATMAVALVAPALGAVGYTNAASSLIWPWILSLGLLAVMSTIQGMVFDLFAWITGRREDSREALLPTLVGFAVWLGAAPLLALIWGVRWTTLIDLWQTFLGGFDLGGTVISPTNFLTFAIVFAIGYGLTRVVQGVLRNSILPKTRMDEGGKNAILSGAGYIGFFIAALVAITLAGIDLSGLAIVAGALSVGIGFGLQAIVSNFVSGIILLVERPIKLGDWISVGGVSGYVRDISVRSTRIETFDRQDVIVPNSDLISGVVTNYTLTSSAGRLIVPVGVAYGNDTRKIEAILREIAEAHPMVLLNPAPSVVFQGFGADSLDFEIRVILRDVNWMLTVKSEMNHQIAQRFTEEGIEIPFMQRDIWIRNPEALAPAGTQEQEETP